MSASYSPTLRSTLSTVCPLVEHLITLASGCLVVDSPTLVHLDFWELAFGPRDHQDKSQAAAYRNWTVDARSNAPSLRTVRCIFTRTMSTSAFSSYKWISNPDWPWVCHPRLLAEDSDDVPYHHFPIGQVAQTVAAIIPEHFWQMSWEGDEFEAGEDWPGVDGDLDELERRVDEEREENDRGLEEWEARGREASSSEWTSDDSEEGGDSVLNLNEHDAEIGENIEGTDGPEEV